MEQVQFCESTEFGAIRMVDDNGKILFCGTDVARVLGYDGNPQDAIRRHCREDGCVNHAVTDSLGRTQQAKFIDEGNLYRLIASSKLPAAEKFERWVFDEVLPAIRRNGAYVPQVYDGADDTAVPQEILTPHDYLQAARLVANCADKRLPLVLDLLHKGGWDVDTSPQMRRYWDLQRMEGRGIDVSDIGAKLRHASKVHGVTYEQISEATGLSISVLRRYTCDRFPKPERYLQICDALETLEEAAGTVTQPREEE